MDITEIAWSLAGKFGRGERHQKTQTLAGGHRLFGQGDTWLVIVIRWLVA